MDTVSRTTYRVQESAEIVRAFTGRRQWPAGMKRYVASLYATDLETWPRVSDFVEQAISRRSVV